MVRTQIRRPINRKMIEAHWALGRTLPGTERVTSRITLHPSSSLVYGFPGLHIPTDTVFRELRQVSNRPTACSVLLACPKRTCLTAYGATLFPFGRTSSQEYVLRI
jgi:hypothetical protein